MSSLVWGPIVNIVLLSLGNSCTEEPRWHWLQQGTPPGMSGDWGALSHHRQLHLRRRPHAQHLQDIQVRNSLFDIQCFGTNVMIDHLFSSTVRKIRCEWIFKINPIELKPTISQFIVLALLLTTVLWKKPIKNIPVNVSTLPRTLMLKHALLLFLQQGNLTHGLLHGPGWPPHLLQVLCQHPPETSAQVGQYIIHKLVFVVSSSSRVLV